MSTRTGWVVYGRGSIRKQGLLNTKDLASYTYVVVEGLQLWGRHGVLAEEQAHPQAFEVDLRLKLPRVTTDDLAQTVDYRQAIQTVQDLNQSHNFQLIEVFAYALGQALLDAFERVLEVEVRVRKHPVFPVGVHLAYVGVEVCCQRGVGPLPTSG